MSDYKCICCGEIKDSENICMCPTCGYKMFELPYNRRDVLTGEIKHFITEFTTYEIIREDLIFDKKKKDDERFPDFIKIQKYVANKEKTEEFLKALRYSVQNIQEHFREEFSKIYKIDFSFLESVIKNKDDTLRSAISKLCPEDSINIKEFSWPNAKLIYSSTSDKYLASSAHELLEIIGKLSEKIEQYVKQYNLYGEIHKIEPRDGFRAKDNTDYKDEIENCIEKSYKVLGKEYDVDILEGGDECLQEMLTTLWNSIEMIMRAPLLLETFDYQLEGNKLSEKEFLSSLTKIVNNRYNDILVLVNNSGFLGHIGEDDVFDLYNQMLALDTWGILGEVNSKLLSFGDSEKQLNNLIGLSVIKESIKKIKAYTLANKDSDNLNLHMCFYGNPGTGKTEVARIVAGILHENGILPTDKVIEVDRGGLVGQYVGETSLKTQAVIDRAMGGVLFVDEAYALAPKGSAKWEYGHEAIATLLKAMEDNRGKFCVILAGYKKEMLEMLSSNPGFISRIQFELDFPNYSRSELGQIARFMLNKNGYNISDSAFEKALDITDIKRKDQNFANAREVRNMMDQIIMCQNIRVAGADNHEIEIIDVNKYIEDTALHLPTKGSGYKKSILTGDEELERLVGLESVKKMIRKIKAYAKKNKDDPDFNIHMCFYGNPGTGKTEVARILSRILHEAGVLKESKLVETDAEGLIDAAIGKSAEKTHEKIDDAMGGVLFIDEAYSLASGSTVAGKGSGAESIATLLKEMEDYRGQFCTILAGYKKEMLDMLSSNPGFKSRIQFNLEFPDYSREELSDIAHLMLDSKGYLIDDSALKLILDLMDYYRDKPDFANARTMRNILDQVIMNQNLRTENIIDDKGIVDEDVEEYINDESIELSNKSGPTGHIGFV